MKAGTHVIGAVTGGLAVQWLTPVPFAFFEWETSIYVASLVFGGLAPDICQPNSWMGRRVPGVSHLISKLVGHRTFTHSLLLVLLVFLSLAQWQEGWGLALQWGISLGIVSHIVLDMMTTKGVHLLFPLHYAFRFPFTTKTGSTFGEGLINALLIAGLFYVSFQLFSIDLTL
ncbi:inner membrane protein [Marinococcus luteus]|jgi:inner membrane protein|uniref:Inner membrane protein n=1 Tax=Marinococcus luteus TaxID=1122204 RepID=A0A1H2R4U0_9BACI|nr:metal-dependent hydrolase [Marinococcus luteus]SDW14456.1 inner membrane protein [Marinococcus luteus]